MPDHDHERRDGEMISRWVREHARCVRGYLIGLVGNVDAAEDLLQEVFRKAWQARGRYQEQGHERAYLLRIADRLACDRARRLGVEFTVGEETWTAVEPQADVAGPEESLMREESHAELENGLQRLSGMQRRVLLLRYYGNMEFVEIAATLDVPLGTALSHCRRGLLSLRKMLAENLS